MQYIWTIKLNSRHFVQKVDSDGSILVKDKIRSVTEREREREQPSFQLNLYIKFWRDINLIPYIIIHVQII